MMKILDAARLADAEVLNRRIEDYTEYEPVVRGIISRVREEGDAALRDFAEKFDGGAPASLELSAEERRAALARVSDEYKAMLERAAANIREFHENRCGKVFLHPSRRHRAGAEIHSRPKSGHIRSRRHGELSQHRADERNPRKSCGRRRDNYGDAASARRKSARRDSGGGGNRRRGQDIPHRRRGSDSRAGFRHGKRAARGQNHGARQHLRRPRQKEVFGTVGIDMVAGPSEILVIADDSADAPTVAADLLSQAEHDRLASAVLVTTDRTLAENVAAEAERQLALLPREEIARASVENCGKIIVADSIDEAVRISNAIAPEHLELCVKDPFALLDKITAAGSIFLGHNTPEAAGDYFAGPNHTLPTGGSARFSSPLSVDDFVKKSSFVCYSKDAFENAIDDIVMFAESEGLSAHARSAEARRK